jgi:hypothetical protein
MEKYTIKELGDFINAINKNPDAEIEITVDRTGGLASTFSGNGGLFLKITPPAPVHCEGVEKCKSNNRGK